MLAAFLALQPKTAVFKGRLEKWVPGEDTSEVDGYHHRAMLYEAMLGLVGVLGKKVRLREEDAA